MIETLQLINFQSIAKCCSELRYSRESFLPINYTFKAGNIYGLISDFGCGSWGLSTCLGGRCDSNYTGRIYVNQKEVLLESLKNSSAFVAESIFDSSNSKENLLTVRECIQKALILSGLPYSIDEIVSIFHLSDGRLDRSLSYVSGEIWLISIAINFALGKDIFCYPWLNLYEIGRFKTAVELNIIDFLKKMGKIVIVPSSQKKILKKYCDHTICFSEKKILYC